MTTTTVHTVRLDKHLTKLVDDEAKRRRLASGENVSKADIIREALDKYLGKK